MGTKVTVRKKAITNKRQSLYLDFYPPITNTKTGQLTRREFLGLYIFDKPKNPIDKQHNSETLLIADQIKQKRHNELNKPEIYTEFEKTQLRLQELGKKNFVDYFENLCNKRVNSNYSNWASALYYLKEFSKGKVQFSDLNESYFEDFKDFLLTTKSKKSSKAKLSTNSAVSYFNKVKAALRQAFKDGYLQYDLNGKIESIKTAETRREFLTIEELNQLVKTDCINLQLKNVALFSALTGLRFSDIQKLLWEEIEYIDNQGYFIKYEQKKTKSIEMLPISEQAYNLLGEYTEPKKKVFEGLKYSAYSNKHLAQWIGAAGITKNITFHCFRHTYATLQLSNGTDIYTVSKMLGHKDLKTTQIYAKIVDQSKRDATDKIILDL